MGQAGMERALNLVISTLTCVIATGKAGLTSAASVEHQEREENPP